MCALIELLISASNAKSTQLWLSDKLSISQHPWGAKCQHDTRDAHDT